MDASKLIMQEFELRFVNPVDNEIFWKVRNLIQSAVPSSWDRYQNYILCQVNANIQYDSFKDIVAASVNFCNSHGRECFVNRVSYVCHGGGFRIALNTDSHKDV